MRNELRNKNIKRKRIFHAIWKYRGITEFIMLYRNIDENEHCENYQFITGFPQTKISRKQAERLLKVLGLGPRQESDFTFIPGTVNKSIGRAETQYLVSFPNVPALIPLSVLML